MKVLVTGGAGYIARPPQGARGGRSHPGGPGLAAHWTARLRARPDLLRGDIADRALVRGGRRRAPPDLDATITWRRGSSCRVGGSPTSTTATASGARWTLRQASTPSARPGALLRRRRRSTPSGRVRGDRGDPLAPNSPYARTKRMMEEVLQDMAVAPTCGRSSCAYFNPIGSGPGPAVGIYAEPSHVLGQLVMAAARPEGLPHSRSPAPSHPTPRRHGHPDYGTSGTSRGARARRRSISTGDRGCRWPAWSSTSAPARRHRPRDSSRPSVRLRPRRCRCARRRRGRVTLSGRYANVDRSPAAGLARRAVARRRHRLGTGLGRNDTDPGLQ